MSGFEVAGIVLGSIPIVIEGCRFFLRAIQDRRVLRKRYYTNELSRWIGILETEQALLKNVCAKLLNGLAPSERVRELVSDPLSPLWQDPILRDSVDARLAGSGKVFSANLKDISEAIEEMNQLLGIEPSAKEFIPPQAESGLGRLLLRLMYLLLRRSDFKDVTERLRSGIWSLQRLVETNLDLADYWRVGYLEEMSKDIQTVLRNAHTALEDSLLPCSCPGREHHVDLGLFCQRELFADLSKQYGKYDRSDLRLPALRVAVSLPSTQGPQLNEDSAMCQELDLLWSQPRLSKLLSAAGTLTSKVDMLASAVGSLAASVIDVLSIVEQQRSNEKRIRDLCHMLRTTSPLRQGKVYGLLGPLAWRDPRLFTVYGAWETDQGLVPLREVLKTRPIKYPDQIQLAWSLIWAVAQLYGTPWFSGIPTADSFFLRRERGAISYRNLFIRNHLPKSSLPSRFRTSQTSSGAAPSNAMMLALGIVLIEIMTREPFDEDHVARFLASPEDDLAYQDAYLAASQRQQKLLMIGGAKYYGIVEYCIRNSLQNEDKAELYKVLAKALGALEKDGIRGTYGT